MFAGLFGDVEVVEGIEVPVTRAPVIRSWLLQARALGYLAELVAVSVDGAGHFTHPYIDLRVEPDIMPEKIKLMADFTVDVFETCAYVIEPKPSTVPMMYLDRDDQIDIFFRVLREGMLRVVPDQLSLGAQVVFYYAHNWNQRFTFEQCFQLLPLLLAVPSFFRAITQLDTTLTFEQIMVKYRVAFDMVAAETPTSLIVDFYPTLQRVKVF